MKLSDLEPEFLRWERRDDGHTYHVTVDTKAEAMGVGFLCPKCFTSLGGKRGCHWVVCWSRSAGTPDIATPGPGRWKMDGTSMADLTLNAETKGGARSVQLTGGCGFHGYITDGEASVI